MTQEYPTTPPLKLVQQWKDQASYYGNTIAAIEDIATQAARWGADHELEACCEILRGEFNYHHLVEPLRAARRPKPPSLKEQASEELKKISISPELGVSVQALDTIRRALESLPE